MHRRDSRRARISAPVERSGPRLRLAAPATYPTGCAADESANRHGHRSGWGALPLPRGARRAPFPRFPSIYPTFTAPCANRARPVRCPVNQTLTAQPKIVKRCLKIIGTSDLFKLGLRFYRRVPDYRQPFDANPLATTATPSATKPEMAGSHRPRRLNRVGGK